jgi:hypothetical protein
MNNNRDWNEVWKKVLDGLKYKGCVDYLYDLSGTLWKYELPDDVVATVLTTISSYMKFEPFPTDDKYFTEGWSLSNRIWIKISSEGLGISEGIENEKQLIWFINYITGELPTIVFKVFKLIISEKKRNRHVQQELSDLLFKMKLTQVEINAGIIKGVLDGIYPHLIELLDLYLNFDAPEPEKRIYGFRLNFVEYNVEKKDKAIEMLFDGLKKAKLIDPDTEFNVFRTIFDSTREIEPVVWIGQTNQLLYFFWLLYRNGILQGKGKEHPHDWEKMEKCFVKKDNKSFLLKKNRKSFGEFDNKTGISVNKREPIKNLLDSIVKFWKNR